MSYEEFGKRLRDFIAQSGKTQKGIADMAKIHPVCLCEYIAGRKAPTVHSACRLASALGVSLDELLTGRKLSQSMMLAALEIPAAKLTAEADELERAAKISAESGMYESGATFRNRAAGLRRAVQILTQKDPVS